VQCDCSYVFVKADKGKPTVWDFNARFAVGLGFATLLIGLLRAHAAPLPGGRIPISFYLGVGTISLGIGMAKAKARSGARKRSLARSDTRTVFSGG